MFPMHLLFACYFLLDGAVNIDVLKNVTRKIFLLLSGSLLMKCVCLFLFRKNLYRIVKVKKKEMFTLEALGQFFRSGLGR